MNFLQEHLTAFIVVGVMPVLLAASKFAVAWLDSKRHKLAQRAVELTEQEAPGLGIEGPEKFARAVEHYKSKSGILGKTTMSGMENLIAQEVVKLQGKSKTMPPVSE